MGQARGTGQPGDGRATEDDLARRGGEQPREHAEQRRLAAAARTQCQHHLPVLGCEAQPLERAHRPARVVVLDGEAAHLQVGPDGAERGATPLGVGRMHGPNATVRGMRPRGNPRAPGRTGGDDVYSLSRWQPLRVVRARLLRAAVRRGSGGGAAALVERLPEEARVLLLRDGLDPVPALTDGPPVRAIPLPLGLRGWVVTGYEDVRTVLADSQAYSNDFGHLVGRPGISAEHDPGGLGMSDPPQHTRLRRLLAPTDAGTAGALRPRVAQIVDVRLDALAAAGDATVDLWRVWALPVPAMVIGELLGLGSADREALVTLSARRFDATSGARASLDAVGASLLLLRDIVARERREPGPGLLGRLVGEHGDDVTDAELAGLADGLVTGGLETTASTLALGAVMLTEDPGAAAALRAGADPDPYVSTVLRHISAVRSPSPASSARPPGSAVTGSRRAMWSCARSAPRTATLSTPTTPTSPSATGCTAASARSSPAPSSPSRSPPWSAGSPRCSSPCPARTCPTGPCPWCTASSRCPSVSGNPPEPDLGEVNAQYAPAMTCSLEDGSELGVAAASRFRALTCPREPAGDGAGPTR